MSKHLYTNASLPAFLMAIILMVSCSQRDIQIARQLNLEATIYPDYKEVTIPVNIAPLNFSVADSSEYCLIAKGKESQFQVHSDNGLFDIPQKKWKVLLQENAGGRIEMTIAKRIDGEWSAYIPFHLEIVKDSIDKYIAYRLLAMSNDMWNRMGIYQRDLENYDQSVIYENSLTDYNCVNCHTFSSQNPNKMIFHMRGLHAGSVLIDGKKITKLNTKTPETVSNFVYMSWHPDGNYLAATVCNTFQHFFINNPNTLEVLDHNSDIVIYDSKKNEMFTCDGLNSKDAWQIFPNFSPDGKSLYFSSTEAVNSLEQNFRQMTYSICRIGFDPETRTFRPQVDTLYNGRLHQKSASFPKVSPNNKYLAFTLQEYGGFGVWHRDADLYMTRLSDGKTYPLVEANSAGGDSYHSWSHNSHWLVFSSRRLDGLYSRPFFTYIDDKGIAHKPFLLPQKNPVKYYKDLLWTYNLPEFIQEKVQVDTHAIMKTMRESKGINVK